VILSLAEAELVSLIVSEVARKSGLLIGTPGDFLAWFRKRLEGE
jgi:hypothetical protein